MESKVQKVAGNSHASHAIFGNNVDILEEILKHLDAKSVGIVSCVSKGCQQAAESEYVWKIICTHICPSSVFETERLQSRVATMGGFKRLYTNFLHPLRSYSHHKHCSSLNEDVIRLSLSLFSVDYYERRLESLRTRNASNFKIHSGITAIDQSPDSCTDIVQKSMKENRRACFI
ncbi:hypothetical protein SUGI_0256550 [Cryptomeria japonica]|uniref:F-box protein GID2-like n=1 Tax=Cryptomeria japonica TaxID=3369 RepID=UPI002408B50A|nr:F-box protein GID2-like [Cryptomeria japonica]GLJ15608.1 hypothetical protein SUGI_0256550 [Cryptomeria japonica]